jgi:hypothetical protein
VIEDKRQPAEPPVMLEDLSASLVESTTARKAAGAGRALARALGDSRAAAIASTVRSAVVDEESAVLAAGIALVAAMTTHMLLLATAQPYPYPGYSTYWLPTTLLAFGIVLIAARRSIGAAWRDRADRSR